MKDSLCRGTQINKYNTKAANRTFYKPQFNTKMCQFSIKYRGAHIWNSLMKDNGEVQELPYNSFKMKIKIICLSLVDTERFFLNLCLCFCFKTSLYRQ